MSIEPTVLHGIVRNGVIILDESVTAPDGARAMVLISNTELPEYLLNELKDWDSAGEESWGLIDRWEADEQSTMSLRLTTRA